MEVRRQCPKPPLHLSSEMSDGKADIVLRTHLTPLVSTLGQTQPSTLRLPPDLFLGESFLAERATGPFGALLQGSGVLTLSGPRKLPTKPGVNEQVPVVQSRLVRAWRAAGSAGTHRGALRSRTPGLCGTHFEN